MITPQDAEAMRGVRASQKYKVAERDIDEILCGPPNEGTTWAYDLPDVRDNGVLKRTIAADYNKAGWQTSLAGNRITLYYQAPPQVRVEPLAMVCERCAHPPHAGGKCSHRGYNPSTHEDNPCRCELSAR